MQIEKCGYGNVNYNLFRTNSGMQVSFKLRAANENIPGAMKAVREAKRAKFIIRWAEALLIGGTLTASGRDEILKICAEKLAQLGL